VITPNGPPSESPAVKLNFTVEAVGCIKRGSHQALATRVSGLIMYCMALGLFFDADIYLSKDHTNETPIAHNTL
jgi:hypothetical protein